MTGFRLLSPNGGEVWENGISQTVSWDGSALGSSGKVRIILSNNVGYDAEYISANDGREVIPVKIPDYDISRSTLPGDAGGRFYVAIYGDDGDNDGPDFFDNSDGIFFIKPIAVTTQASINISWPANKPTLIPGQTHTIKWNASGVSTLNINLGKYSDAMFWMNIAQNVLANQGYYTWTVPSYLQTGDDYRIHLQQIISSTDMGVWDQEPVSIASGINPPAPQPTGNVKVISPNGGQTLTIGSETTISWTDSAPSFSTDDTYKVYVVGGANKYWIGSSVGGKPSASMAWKAGSYDGGTLLPDYAYIRIEKYRSGALISSDNSDSQFSLIGTTPTLRVQVPNGGETIMSGSTGNAISYTALGLDRVDIQLRRVDTGVTYLLFKESLTTGGNSSGGFFSGWTPRLENYGGGQSGNFVVKICQTGTSFCDESDAPFKIVMF